MLRLRFLSCALDHYLAPHGYASFQTVLNRTYLHPQLKTCISFISEWQLFDGAVISLNSFPLISYNFKFHKLNLIS